jgi:hypothetical protein
VASRWLARLRVIGASPALLCLEHLERRRLIFALLVVRRANVQIDLWRRRKAAPFASAGILPPWCTPHGARTTSKGPVATYSPLISDNPEPIQFTKHSSASRRPNG